MSADWNPRFGTREDEAAAIFFDLIQAGLTQVPLMLRNGIGHLVSNSGDRETLSASPDLAAHLADEVLRLYPISFPARVVRRDIVVADTEFHVGDVVLPLIGFANRDGLVFDHPHCAQLDRARPKEHLSFGAGPHYCLGGVITHDILTATLVAAGPIIQKYQLPTA